MSPLETVEKLNAIIDIQSGVINELFALLMQHISADEADALPAVKRINEAASLRQRIDRGAVIMDEQRFVSMEMHKEFEKRMDIENRRLSDEDKRQNRRIDELEGTVRQIGDLTASVKELAVSMKNMTNIQEQQGKRLDVLENQDGEMWRKVTGYIFTAILGIVIGFIFKQIGM